MIHDATGKFSSRWVLPDRNWLALVIRNRAFALKHGLRTAADWAGMRRDRGPHLGVDDGKTNAFRDAGDDPAASEQGRKTGPSEDPPDANAALLSVILQHQI